MTSTRDKFLQILNFKEIKKSGIGNAFRHITLQDIHNQKTVDHVLFKDKHESMWSEILNMNFKDKVYSGEIINIKITDKLIKGIKSNFPLTIKEGDVIDLVIWGDNGWDPLDKENRILNALQEQIWRFRTLPPKK